MRLNIEIDKPDNRVALKMQEIDKEKEFNKRNEASKPKSFETFQSRSSRSLRCQHRRS